MTDYYTVRSQRRMGAVVLLKLSDAEKVEVTAESALVKLGKVQSGTCLCGSSRVIGLALLEGSEPVERVWRDARRRFERPDHHVRAELCFPSPEEAVERLMESESRAFARTHQADQEHAESRIQFLTKSIEKWRCGISRSADRVLAVRALTLSDFQSAPEGANAPG